MSQLHTVKTNRLTKGQAAQAGALFDMCQRADSLTLSFPAEDADAFYLLYEKAPEGASLSSVMAVCLFDGQPAEVSAFTAPDARRRGYFSLLLSMVLEDFPEEEFLFPADGRCLAALSALEALGAEHVRDEYMMEAVLREEAAAPAGFPEGVSVCQDPSRDEEDSHFLIVYEGRRIGEYFLSPLNGSCYFYGFWIEPKSRRRGFGSSAFSQALWKAREAGYSSLLLQVSSGNAAAVHLYRRAGLFIRETLSYYLY